MSSQLAIINGTANIRIAYNSIIGGMVHPPYHRASSNALREHSSRPRVGVDEIERNVAVSVPRGDMQSTPAVTIGQPNISTEPHKQLDEVEVAAAAALM